MSDTRPPRPSTAQAPPPGDPGKPAGTRSLVEQIVAEQKKQKAEMRDALHRKDKRSKIGPVAAGVLILANLVAWLVFPPVGNRGQQRTPAQVERNLRLVVASAASQVEVWRQSHDGRLPPSLATAGVADSGLTFVNVDGTVYEVRGESHGVKLSYRSNMPVGDFLDAGAGVGK